MKGSQEELKAKLVAARQEIEIGDKYYHFRDPSKLYLIVAVAIFEEDEEPIIIYKALYDEKITWARKLSLFQDLKEDADGNLVPRFQKYLG
ncbi:MAG: hypothetical protein Fur003_2430 [Candidatus Dojkabacteria bacterium]